MGVSPLFFPSPSFFWGGAEVYARDYVQILAKQPFSDLIATPMSPQGSEETLSLGPSLALVLSFGSCVQTAGFAGKPWKLRCILPRAVRTEQLFDPTLTGFPY